MKIETPATLGAKLLPYIIVGLVVIGLIWGAKIWYDRIQAKAAQLDMFKNVTATVSHVTAAQATASQAAGSVTQHVNEVRTIYTTRYEELKREDPTLSAYADQCVPIKLRRLACERRAALHGIGDSASGCDRFDGKEECAR